MSGGINMKMTGCGCMDGLLGDSRKEVASSEMRGKQTWGGYKRQKKKKGDKKMMNSLEACQSFLCGT